MLALGLGCSVYTLSIPKLNVRLAAILIAILLTGGMVYFVSLNPYVLDRWQQTIQEGATSKRDVIFAAAFEMFLERPIIGWHPLEFLGELGKRTGIPFIGAHNLYLHLLLEVGLLGAIPFFTGLFLCFRAAWKTRSGPLGSIPFALLVTVLVGNMSGEFVEWRSFWFVLALAVASSAAAANKRMITPAHLAVFRRKA
jgi:O-antigen ligase